MVNKAFVSVSDGVSSMGNFTLGSTETVTLTPKEVRKAAAAGTYLSLSLSLSHTHTLSLSLSPRRLARRRQQV